MGHLIAAKEEVYLALAERLNKNPVGAPINETLMEILHRLYTESEALVASKFPMLPLTLDKISAITGHDKGELKEVLESMAGKGLVLDLPRRENTLYMLAPMVVGFFEYTFMRIRDNINMKEMAELFEAYFKSPEVWKEFFGGDTKLFQALVYENVIPVAVETEVLSHERASEIIRQSGGGCISICSCRHKASHLGKACDAPMDLCMSLGNAAQWLIQRGLGKPATVDQLLQALDRAEQHGLVHLGDNVLNKPAYICNCCGCCCQVLRGVNQHGKLPAHPSNFLPEPDYGNCLGCGACESSCQTGAIYMHISDGGKETPVIDFNLCLGCGVCARACPNSAVNMARRESLRVPPDNKRELFTMIAKEKGRK